MGCYSIAGLLPALNLPVPIYIPAKVEKGTESKESCPGTGPRMGLCPDVFFLLFMLFIYVEYPTKLLQNNNNNNNMYPDLTWS